MTAAAAIATAVGWYVRRPDDWLVLRVRLGGEAFRRADWSPARVWMLLAVAGTVVVTSTVSNPASQAALVAFAAAALFGVSLRRGATARRQAAQFRSDISRVLGSVAAELRAGVEPLASLRAAVADSPAVWEPVRGARTGDIVLALRAMSLIPGGESLVEVAAAWQIAEQTGSSLAAVLDRVASAVRAEVELDRDVAVEAAPARATGRLMALLPLAGLGLGMLLGANPVRVLVASGVGVMCLVAGLGLACLGVWRIERIVAEVERR